MQYLIDTLENFILLVGFLVFFITTTVVLFFKMRSMVKEIDLLVESEKSYAQLYNSVKHNHAEYKRLTDDTLKSFSETAEFHKKEAAELNQSYKAYMDSIEVMIKQHAADLATVMDENKNLRQANQNMQAVINRKGAGGVTVIDFSPESKINTALEQ